MSGTGFASVTAAKNIFDLIRDGPILLNVVLPLISLIHLALA